MSKATETHVKCPIENCPCGGSSDAFVWYDDGHGWCFAGNKGIFPKDKYNREAFEEGYFGDRSIPADMMEKFHIKSYVDTDGEVHFHSYEMREGRIIRRCKDKQFYVEGKLDPLGGMDLWDPGSTPTITVVEGALDAPSAYIMLNGGKVKVERGVVWLTSAGIPRKNRKEIFDYLNQFEKVIIAGEADAAGENALADIAEMLPTKTYRVQLFKHKDANDYLKAGDEEDFRRAWTNASRYVPKNIVSNNEDFFKIVDEEEKDVYIPTPFPALNEKIRGLPLGHIVLLTGQEGIGKTEILRALEWSVLQQDPEATIAVLHFEEKRRTTLFGFSCYHLGDNVRNPDVDNRDRVKKSIQEWNKDSRLHLFDIEDETAVQGIMETLRYLSVICGVKYFFIDPINQVASMEIDDSKTRFLDALTQTIEKFAVRQNVCFVITAHMTDEGKTRDSRMIAKTASIRIDLERDVTAMNDEIKNTTYLTVPKNRFASETGKAGALFFDKGTFTVSEKEGYDPLVVESPSGKKIKAIA